MAHGVHMNVARGGENGEKNCRDAGRERS